MPDDPPDEAEVEGGAELVGAVVAATVGAVVAVAGAEVAVAAGRVAVGAEVAVAGRLVGDGAAVEVDGGFVAVGAEVAGGCVALGATVALDGATGAAGAGATHEVTSSAVAIIRNKMNQYRVLIAESPLCRLYIETSGMKNACIPPSGISTAEPVEVSGR